MGLFKVISFLGHLELLKWGLPGYQGVCPSQLCAREYI